MAQLCVRPKGDPHCPFHPKQNVILRCKECPRHTLVCQQCITSIHEGHTFGEIDDGITEKVDNIKQFIRKTETLTIPRLIAEITSIANKKKTTTEMFKSEIQTAREQAEQLRELVDLQMTKTVSILESEMKDTLTSLDSYQKELEQFKSKLEEDMKDTNTALTSDCNILIFNVEAEIMQKSDDCILPSPRISVPHFLPCKDPLTLVENAFGDLEVKITNPKKKLYDNSRTTAALQALTDRRKHVPTMTSHADKKGKPKAPHKTKKILGQPVQITKLNWISGISSLCPIPTNTAWICSEGDTQLDLINDKGAVQKTLTLDTDIRRICLHPNTGDVYGCCWRDKSIRRIDMQSKYKGKTVTKVLFHTDSKPWSIACTSHNVIVGMAGKVCMYTYGGQVVYSKDMGLYNAFYISVCNITSRVAVACGSYGALVLDNKLQMLYTYTGEGAAAGDLNRDIFFTYCSVFDDNGYLLVGDYNNKEVHILDDTSKNISTIKTKDMTEVRTLGTHDGVMWVGCIQTYIHDIQTCDC